MELIIGFFLKYLLAPILVIVGVIVLNATAKTKGALKMKNLIVFILVLSLVLALPSLLGLLRYEFVWGGVLLNIVAYLLLGSLFNLFIKSSMFEGIGIHENKWHVLLSITIAMILAMWIYYLVFAWMSKLPYAHWAMLLLLWFILPLLYRFSRLSFIDIPTPFYKSWKVSFTDEDLKYWENLDTFKLMQVTVKVKRSQSDKSFSSFSVKLPGGISIGRWFNRFVDDQNIRSPEEPIITSYAEGAYGWIFYKARWFSFPLFTKVIDFEKDLEENNIKNKATIYVKRVTQVNETKTKSDDKPA